MHAFSLNTVISFLVALMLFGLAPVSVYAVPNKAADMMGSVLSPAQIGAVKNNIGCVNGCDVSNTQKASNTTQILEVKNSNDAAHLAGWGAPVMMTVTALAGSILVGLV